MNKTRIIFLNGLLLTLTSLILKSVGMFFGIYISNKIGTEAVGVYQLVMSVYLLFVTFASSGINLATTRIVSEQLAYNNKNKISIAVRKCILYSLVVGSLSAILLLKLAPIISSYWLHNKISPVLLKVIAFSLPFVSTASSINGYFTAIHQVKSSVISQIFEQMLRICIVVFLFNCFNPVEIEKTTLILVFSGTISEILSCTLLYLLYKKNIKNTKILDRSDSFTKQILRITIPISLTSYIRSGLSTLKQILIPVKLEEYGLSCSIALSQYGIINGMALPLIMFPCTFIYSFSLLLIPEFSYLNAKRNYEKINYAVNRILKICFVFSFLIMGVFWCFSHELASFIYNEKSVGLFIKILAPLIVLMYIDNIVDSILKGLDKQVSVMGINILDLITTISLIYFLLPLKGINGYIIVLFISEILNGILSLFLLLKEIHLKIDFANWIFKPILGLLISNFIFKNLICNNIMELIIQVLFFTIIYFIIIVILKGIIKDDIKI